MQIVYCAENNVVIPLLPVNEMGLLYQTSTPPPATDERSERI